MCREAGGGQVPSSKKGVFQDWGSKSVIEARQLTNPCYQGINTDVSSSGQGLEWQARLTARAWAKQRSNERLRLR